MRIFDSWWRAECISMSVYTVQQECDPSHITGRAAQWSEKWPCSPICLSGAHLGGAYDLQTYSQQCTNPDVQGMKETFSPSLFLPLLLFACFHRSVNVIWVCEWYFILTVLRLADGGFLALRESKSSAQINPALLCDSIGRGNRRSPPLLCKNRSLQVEWGVSTWEMLLVFLWAEQTLMHMHIGYTCKETLGSFLSHDNHTDHTVLQEENYKFQNV